MARERNENTDNVLNFELDDENTFEVIELDQCDSPGDLANEVCDLDLEDESYVEGGANDDSDLTVSLHDGSVFCVVLAPGDHPVAVTGGEDNRAFVWRLCDGSTVFECSGLPISLLEPALFYRERACSLLSLSLFTSIYMFCPAGGLDLYLDLDQNLIGLFLSPTQFIHQVLS
uniref:Uncharacterized protein n=1 Tax=Eptatretus burgeri TaxID=7764 RepID=A0A8C4R2R4_EPTBU